LHYDAAFGGKKQMSELDFSAGAPAPKPATVVPQQVYSTAMAMEFFRVAGKAEAAPAGTKFFEENQKAGFLKRDKMYLLLEGEVTMSVRGKPIGVVKVGETFGEMAAISEQARSATATAKTNCRVIALDDKQFQAGLKQKPEFALMMMSIMILRLRGMIARLAQSSTLGGAEGKGENRVFDKNVLAALAKGLGETNTVRFNEGQIIFRQGAQGAMMYVILNGRVKVSIEGAVVDKVGQGGVFGEMALVDQGARAATATAETDVEMIALNRNIFLNLVKSNPEFGASLLGAVAERVRYTASRMP
jgi:CRP/FNR family cyclic AMP-dependent transcriptional regulator